MKPHANLTEHQCDILWQRLMVKLWKGRCGICSSTRGLAGHHLVKRRHMQFRHDPQNGILLCQRCHRDAEEHQVVFLSALKIKRPEVYRWQKEANRISMKPCQPVLESDLRIRLEKLKSMVALGCGTSS